MFITPPLIYAFRARTSFAVSKSSTIIENSLDFAAKSTIEDILGSNSKKSIRSPLNPCMFFSLIRPLIFLSV